MPARRARRTRRAAHAFSSSATTSPGWGWAATRRASWSSCSGEALADGATALITTGAVQSNHARMTAAAAAGAGSTRIWCSRPPRRPGRRRQPAASIGCSARRVSFVPAVDPMLAVGHDEAVVAEVAARIRAAGRAPVRDSRRRIERRRRARICGRHAGARGTARRDRRAAVAPVLRQRLAGHSGRVDARARTWLHASYRLYGVAVSAGEPEKIERARRVAREAAAPARRRRLGGRGRILYRSALHRRRAMACRRRGPRRAPPRGAHRGPGARPDLHVEGDGGARAPRPRRRGRRRRHRGLPAYRRSRRRSSPTRPASGWPPPPVGSFENKAVIAVCRNRARCPATAHDPSNLIIHNELAATSWPCQFESVCRDAHRTRPARSAKSATHGPASSRWKQVIPKELRSPLPSDSYPYRWQRPCE